MINSFKIILTFLLFLLSAIVIADENYFDYLKNRKVMEHEKPFVGTWEGSHYEKKDNITRSWIQYRFDTGTFVTEFSERKNGQLIDQFKYYGYWAIKGDMFIEYDKVTMDNPDIYTYKIINKNQIEFKSTKNDYKFTDTRI